MTDHDLLQAWARRRDAGAMAELVHRHGPTVYHAALRQAGDAAAAQDIAQAAFIALSEKAAGIGRGVVVAGWLYRAVGYAAANARKTARRRAYHERQAAMLRDKAAQTAHAAEEPWTALAPALDAAMARLTAGDRDVLLLRYFQNLPLADVAAALGIAERAAQKRVSRALDRLRGLLAPAATVSAAALAVTLSTRAASACQPATVAAMTAGATADAAVLSTASVELAKGVTAMLTGQKVFAAACVAAVLFLGGGAAYLAATRTAPAAPAVPQAVSTPAAPTATPAGTQVATQPALVAPAASAPATAPAPVAVDRSTPRKTLESIYAAFLASDIDAVTACMTPVVDKAEQARVQVFFDIDVAVSRYRRAAAARFGAAAAKLPKSMNTLDELIADVLKRSDAAAPVPAGDTATLTVDGDVPRKEFEPWRKAAIHFKKDKDGWKVDGAATFEFKTDLRWKGGTRGTEAEALEFLSEMARAYDDLRARIERGAVPDVDAAAREMAAALGAAFSGVEALGSGVVPKGYTPNVP